jgi:hypothetical protein
MKKFYALVILVCSITFTSIGQVRISNDNSGSDPSAMLDVKSTDQGFLPPRMTMVQRDAIASPVDGLMIYCHDCPVPNNLQIYTGTKWHPIAYNRFPYATSVNQSGNPWFGFVLR